ncbi:MAG: hypothetical protein KDC54_21235 [Lewinella sp.]|nr:hypothetical protein [Lewinella sp.]
MNRLLLFAALLSLAACQGNGVDEATTETAIEAADPRLDFTIEIGQRVGLITPDSSSRELVLALYGDSARVEEVYLGEGLYEEGVVLFPDNPRRRVEIYWEPQFDPVRPSYLRISGYQGETDWKTTEGITVGTTLTELNRLNGRPFQLYGFGWDYGGSVVDWMGGQLSNELGLRLEPGAEAQASMEVVGDQLIRSDHPALAQMDVRVDVLDLHLGRSYHFPEGQWQSTTDPGYVLEFLNGELIHRNGGEETLRATIYLDASCQDAACGDLATNRPDGQWCFIEVDEYGQQCNLVLESTGERLVYSAVGGLGNSLEFVAIEED